LLAEYKTKKQKTIDDIIDFHQWFESVHPFQDGNGRVGRLIMFKECLAHGVTLFIIAEDTRWYYYRGLREWKKEKCYLLDTCLTAQDIFKKWLEYFAITI
jgi:Fic family protein